MIFPLSPFRFFIEAIKEVACECHLHFEPDGIDVLAVDSANTALVHAKLPARIWSPPGGDSRSGKEEGEGRRN